MKISSKLLTLGICSLYLSSCSATPQNTIDDRPMNEKPTMQASNVINTNGPKTNLATRPDVMQFIQNVSQKHNIDSQWLVNVFNQTEIKTAIIDAMNRPAEKKKTWAQYRPIFITNKRIQDGVAFWNAHQSTLESVQASYGVPAEYIVAIIGVETSYGGNKGKWRVMDALSTLSFEYPKRSKFFSKELESFLTITYNNQKDPLSYVGSYAGAMGYPQFMPSSYLAYAADFNNDGYKDLWDNPDDAIASVANYFKKHGWVTGGTVAIPTTINQSALPYVNQKLQKPNYSIAELRNAGVNTNASPNSKALLLEFEGSNGNEYWLGFQNFYTITRYNHSTMYALAVHQLAEAMKARR